MRAAIGGDTAAYDRLLRSLAGALRPTVRHALTRAGRSVGDLEDIVQEVLLAVHLKRHTWDSKRPIGPWIGAIARYKVVDALRRRGGRCEFPVDLFADSLQAPEERPSIDPRDLERHLERLSSRQREIVMRIAIEGRSIADCATQLGMTEVAVRVALHRSLTALAKSAD